VLSKQVGDWKKVSDVLSAAPRKLEAAMRKATLQEGQFMRSKIVQGITRQAPGGKPFTPLADGTLITRRAKGFHGTKALIVRADLRNSISVKEHGDGLSGGVFIGIQRSARSPSGKSMVDIAEIHEFGSKPLIIQMTPKMKRFLRMAYRKAMVPFRPGNGTGIIVSRIPARPFLRPVFDEFGSGTVARIEERLVKLLKGSLAG
jgi:hypothetical protein